MHAEFYAEESENTWYYFTQRERKYENGKRPSRSAGNGYWKIVGKDAQIKNTQGNVIGFRNSLTFCIGKQPHGKTTSWHMQEFRLCDTSDQQDKIVVTKPKPKKPKRDASHSNEFKPSSPVPKIW